MGNAVKTAQYDHVIVGGGSAGSVLANRLTADPTREVLVLESGRPDYAWDVLARMPAGVAFVLGRKQYDWRYRTEAEPHLRGRRVDLPSGRLLGGSSNINGMIFQRGNPMDYEGWAAQPGMQHWSYAHVLPYLKRMEDSATAARSVAAAGRSRSDGDAGTTRCSRRSCRPPYRRGTRPPTT